MRSGFAHFLTANLHNNMTEKEELKKDRESQFQRAITAVQKAGVASAIRIC